MYLILYVKEDGYFYNKFRVTTIFSLNTLVLFESLITPHLTNQIIMKTSEISTQNACEQCHKKEQLIEKYLNLIDLLKRKNDVSNNSAILKQSVDAPTTNTTNYPTQQKFSKAILAFKLMQFENNNKKYVFEVLMQHSIQQKCHRGFKMAQALDRCINRRTLQAIRNVWINKNKQVLIVERQSQDKTQNLGFLDSSEPLRNVSCLLPGQSLSINQKTRNMSRKLFSMNQQISSLKAEKKVLVIQIEENLRRQEIESKKKKQSLEMLAEEMAQKNQLISQLQETVQFYEAKLGKKGGNVLEDDSIAMKRELQVLEKANEKINVQLQKRVEQISKLQEQLKTLSQKSSKLEIENSKLKQSNFQMGVELQGIEKKKKEYYSLSSFLQKKLSNLKKYEKLISNNLKALDQYSLVQKSSFNSTIKPRNSKMDLQEGVQQIQDRAQSSPFSPISCFEAQYKIEKVLNYIFNIQLQDVWIKNDQKLFDHQEIQVLNGLKLKFIQLNDQVRAYTKPKSAQKQEVEQIKSNPIRLSQQCGESDEVYFNRHHVSGSIFDVLATQKNHKQRDIDQIVNHFDADAGTCPRCGNAGNQETTSRKGEQNFTIRLLQLQLQKSKQVEKISQLKNKLMHIRCIVMNFIKVLDMRSISKEAKEIVEIFCEFFEYSEQEKQQIFQIGKKEKKFLGWF